MADARALKLGDGAARAPARLAENVNGTVVPAWTLKFSRIQIIQRDQSGAGHMAGGKFARRADVNQQRGAALCEAALEFARVDGGMRLR
jgi:hypothetical protein